ncbi:MAG: fatty acid desaturase [Zetaproteobacteria bacterium]|nr:fatty acid desaturase [Zetaproteobacteria bacterium]
MATSAHKDIQWDSFVTELKALAKENKYQANQTDVRHISKIRLWSNLCAAFGYGTAWIAPNPLSAYLISQSKFTRWTTLAHHILHRGFDKIPNTPRWLRSKYFGKGWRRWTDWLDWIDIKAWDIEHNVLHHYSLGEKYDPDVVQYNLSFLRKLQAPTAIKIILIFLLASAWKWIYYAPSTLKQLHRKQIKAHRFEKEQDAIRNYRLQISDTQVYSPFTPVGRTLWRKSYLPYFFKNFVFTPGLAYLISPTAGLYMLLNMLLAEWFTNLHSFIMIVPNHSGDDLMLFQTPCKSKDEFYVRQIMGSANYATGSDFGDFLHGWLNYQIEHHIFPDMTPLQYQKIQPAVKALCQKYQIPYAQESVWMRVYRLVQLICGKSSMHKTDTLIPTTSPA